MTASSQPSARAPIDPATVRAALPDPQRWTIRHVASTGSTNSDLARAATGPTGAPDRTVLITEEQLAGRGRLGRSWQAPAGSALMMSVLLRPDRVPVARRGWVGALLGLAHLRAMDAYGVAANLKWPNDILVDGRKCAGILAELAGPAVVVGCGLNVSLTESELPRADATSLSLEGVRVDRSELAGAVLRELDPLLRQWESAAGDVAASGLLEQYRQRCSTIGQRVVLHLPDGRKLVGTALDVTEDGSLTVRSDAAAGAVPTVASYAAADVQHLRPAPSRAERQPQ
ncbi:biotin--[acetyl-CoA-carboxylase] ligase [Nakamurella aerolata]|uniref:biotin--[biotin carboxyl-carrier protein] ligase n=1 Tax=Nakamurella aerolata TaxID=1656892 RepID=A0A849A8U3_9ACTN|nr:biotin--[acetyl-CoA-carboxylase] ligase [Nakamurella aerolata]NNG36036.1 biotin--[acetyl-CoA-carboxylase] ligase [Nakamurella aerolata]